MNGFYIGLNQSPIAEGQRQLRSQQEDYLRGQAAIKAEMENERAAHRLKVIDEITAKIEEALQLYRELRQDMMVTIEEIRRLNERQNEAIQLPVRDDVSCLPQLAKVNLPSLDPRDNNSPAIPTGTQILMNRAIPKP